MTEPGKTLHFKTFLAKRIEKQIKKGMRIARDPANALLPDLSIRQTTISSEWFTEECPHCNFIFREGDRVRLCPNCSMAYHEDTRYNLQCWTLHFQSSDHVCLCGEFHWDGKVPDSDYQKTTEHGSLISVEELFTTGLRETWKDFGGEVVRTFIARPDDSVVGKRCPMCRFKIRPGDRYVESPCGCNTFFHNDPFRHLPCWNSWSGKDGKGYCPTSGQQCTFQFTKTRFNKLG